MTVAIYRRATGVEVVKIYDAVSVRENEWAITVEAHGQKSDYIKSEHIFVVVAS